jgi:hypothetical protein
VIAGQAAAEARDEAALEREKARDEATKEEQKVTPSHILPFVSQTK